MVPDIMSLAFLVEKLLAKMFLPKASIFTFLTPGAKIVDASSNFMAPQRKNSSRAIEYFFRGLRTMTVSEIMARFRRNIEIH